MSDDYFPAQSRIRYEPLTTVCGSLAAGEFEWHKASKALFIGEDTGIPTQVNAAALAMGATISPVKLWFVTAR